MRLKLAGRKRRKLVCGPIDEPLASNRVSDCLHAQFSWLKKRGRVGASESSMGYDPIDARAGIYWPQIDHKRSIYGNAQRVIDANHPFMV